MSTPVISIFADNYSIGHLILHDTGTGTQTEVWEYGSTGETAVSYRDETLKWTTNKSGRIARVSFYDAARVLHCMGGSAIVGYDKSEHPCRIQYYRHGQLHHMDAPAETRYRGDDSRESEAWHLCSQLDRDDGPVIVEYGRAGQVRCEEWYQSERLHCLNGPAVISYNLNGHVRSQQWYHYGLLHRTDGPAPTLYDKDGQVASEAWSKDGYLTTINPSKIRG